MTSGLEYISGFELCSSALWEENDELFLPPGSQAELLGEFKTSGWGHVGTFFGAECLSLE